jgi:SAM-dependent methyltransferase
VPVGGVRWGSLRRTSPISRRYGYDRGKPIDRYYIEDFLAGCSSDIQGRVLEIKEPEYAHSFDANRVTQTDILDIDAANPKATIIADLNEATPLPSDTYDCIIFTQTLQYIYRAENAVRELHRSLTPGGTLLMTVPGIAPAPLDETRHWTFTNFSVERLLAQSFGQGAAEVRTYGNLVTVTAFLYGLCTQELRADELATHDAEYPLIVAARVVKAG